MTLFVIDNGEMYSDHHLYFVEDDCTLEEAQAMVALISALSYGDGYTLTGTAENWTGGSGPWTYLFPDYVSREKVAEHAELFRALSPRHLELVRKHWNPVP
jgi:hypothetical protein